MQRFDIITLDCYGTLIDWESGIANAFLSAGLDAGRDEILRSYAEHEPLVEQPPYRTYREVLAETTLRVARDLGFALRNTNVLADSLPSWKPFPDTNGALERLRTAGYGMGILSNIDDDLLAATRRHFTVDFDLIVTAQQVQSYKPRHAHFLRARREIGHRRWLHAAESNYHDIVPANELRIENAWVNRRRATQLTTGVPTLGEFRDLAALADAIT